MSGTESLYQELILDHYRHPHGRGLREPYDGEAHHVNPACGDELTVRIRLDGERVEDMSYEAIGCSISQASASVLNDLVVGRTLGEVATRSQAFQEMLRGRGMVQPDETLLEDGVAFAGVARFPVRVKCALLAWAAFADAAVRASAAVAPPPPSTERTVR